MAKKGKELKYIDGMPVSTVRKMMLSDKTPMKLKEAWAKKLDKMGVFL